mgnify:CR=1 FL=1
MSSTDLSHLPFATGLHGQKTHWSIGVNWELFISGNYVNWLYSLLNKTEDLFRFANS